MGEITESVFGIKAVIRHLLVIIGHYYVPIGHYYVPIPMFYMHYFIYFSPKLRN